MSTRHQSTAAESTIFQNNDSINYRAMLLHDGCSLRTALIECTNNGFTATSECSASCLFRARRVHVNQIKSSVGRCFGKMGKRRERRGREGSTKIDGSKDELMMERKTGHLCLMNVSWEMGKWDETKMKRRESEECTERMGWLNR